MLMVQCSAVPNINSILPATNSSDRQTDRQTVVEYIPWWTVQEERRTGTGAVTQSVVIVFVGYEGITRWHSYFVICVFLSRVDSNRAQASMLVCVCRHQHMNI